MNKRKITTKLINKEKNLKAANDGAADRNNNNDPHWFNVLVNPPEYVDQSVDHEEVVPSSSMADTDTDDDKVLFLH